jgi:hypothetical protein
MVDISPWCCSTTNRPRLPPSSWRLAQTVGELMEQGAPAFGATVPSLSQLLKAEMAELSRSVSLLASWLVGSLLP